jgi:hypothetical protein
MKKSRLDLSKKCNVIESGVMKVCGFTIVRNAIKFDYPVIESIMSVLPVCDKFIVCLGNSADSTREAIEAIKDPKIEIIESVWDDSLREGGAVLAVETNKAFDAIPDEFDWAFYIQADEVIHEKYYGEIRSSMEKYLNEPQIEGLLFNYVHFYGNYKYIGDSRKWYRNEIRIIRNNKNIRSYRDAQGFRISGSNKLKARLINAFVYHYGWVKNPYHLQEKQKDFNKFWHSDEWIKKMVKEDSFFDFSTIDSLSIFEGTHPKVMHDRITRQDWDFEFDISTKNFDLRSKVLHSIEKHTGVRLFEYKNYRKV